MFCVTALPPPPLYQKSHRRIRAWYLYVNILVWKTTHKNSDTEQNAFRYRCYALYSIFGVSLENDAEKHFMLRKWQHEQVAPLAIQTPTFGGLCIGCAVLPAQRGFLGCRLGRCFCLRQRCPPDTRTPSIIANCTLLIANFQMISDHLPTSHSCSGLTKRVVLYHGSPSIWRIIHT